MGVLELQFIIDLKIIIIFIIILTPKEKENWSLEVWNNKLLKVRKKFSNRFWNNRDYNREITDLK